LNLFQPVFFQACLFSPDYPAFFGLKFFTGSKASFSPEKAPAREAFTMSGLAWLMKDFSASAFFPAP
jgi:hypothetical protein